MICLVKKMWFSNMIERCVWLLEGNRTNRMIAPAQKNGGWSKKHRTSSASYMILNPSKYLGKWQWPTVTHWNHGWYMLERGIIAKWSQISELCRVPHFIHLYRLFHSKLTILGIHHGTGNFHISLGLKHQTSWGFTMIWLLSTGKYYDIVPIRLTFLER